MKSNAPGLDHLPPEINIQIETCTAYDADDVDNDTVRGRKHLKAKLESVETEVSEEERRTEELLELSRL